MCVSRILPRLVSVTHGAAASQENISFSFVATPLVLSPPLGVAARRWSHFNPVTQFQGTRKWARPSDAIWGRLHGGHVAKHNVQAGLSAACCPCPSRGLKKQNKKINRVDFFFVFDVVALLRTFFGTCTANVCLF